MDLSLLKILARQRRIKINDIVAETGLTRYVISRTINGKGNPSFENVEKITRALGLNITISI